MKEKKTNKLKRARKARGLKQKHVAYLLGHRSVDQISRTESGIQLPSLTTALKLEIILGVPLRLLFQEQYEQLVTEINHRHESNKVLRGLLAGSLVGSHCSYRESLKSSMPSQEDLERARDHSTELSRLLAELWMKP
jgi:transcriptional regulator with XRE-family HTH domain